MKTGTFLELANFEGTGNVYINLETETIREIVDVPKDNEHLGRTRITTSMSVYLVAQSAKKVMAMLLDLSKKRSE